MEGGEPVVYEKSAGESFAQVNLASNGNDSESNWDAPIYEEFYEQSENVGTQQGGTTIGDICSDGSEVRRDFQKKEVTNSPGTCRKRVLTEKSKSERKSYSVSKKDICKKARNSGKSYVKLKGKDVGAFVGEKEVGPDCHCPNRCYEKVGEETIQKIFRDFWALGDYNSQNAYLFGLISLLGVKRRYTKSRTSRRNFTMNYSIKKRGENVNVCKKAFLNIHGLQRNRGRINNLANKMKGGESVPAPDQRGRHTNRPNAYSEEAIFHVKTHLAQCPKVERKKNSGKPSKHMEYSTKRCYDLYVAVYCKEHNLLPVSLDKYRRVFWQEGYRNPQSSSRRPQTSPAVPSSVTIRKLSF